MFSPKQIADLTETELALSLWLDVLRLRQRVWKHGSQLFNEYGLTPQQYAVLLNLQQADGSITQQALADDMNVTKGNVSQMLTVLERDGWVEKIADGASNRLICTEKACSALQELTPLHDRMVAEKFSVLTRGEQEQLAKMFERLMESLA